MEESPINFKRISIVMPVKNGAKYLRRALDSLKIQNYPNLEILACVGPSIDNTKEIFKEYGIPIAYEDDNNAADALINGYRLATGEILGLLPHDDEILPGALHKVNLAFQDHNIEWVYSATNSINTDGSIHSRLGNETNVTLEMMVERNLIPTISSFFKKETYLRVGGIRKAFPYPTDYELWLKMLAVGTRPHKIKDDLAIFHVTGLNGSMDTIETTITAPEVKQLRDIYFKKLSLGAKIRVGARRYRARLKPLLKKYPIADRFLRRLHKIVR